MQKQTHNIHPTDLEAIEGICELVARMLQDPGMQYAVEVVPHGRRLVVMVYAEKPGFLIGRRGVTADAIRTVMNAIGARMSKIIEIEFAPYQEYPNAA